jgi:hypothetical protein
MEGKSFYLGLRLNDLEKARTRIEELLGIEMDGVDSSAFGGELYVYHSSDIPELRLYQNWHAEDGDWNHPEFDFDLLIRIARRADSETIEEKLIGDPTLGAELLRESEY